MEYFTLSNGLKMPKLGYGVYQVDPAEAQRCVSEAIAAGYRHIDTAQAYRNEEGVGAAVSQSGVPREEFFLTTKVWISNAGEEAAARSIDESLKKLRTDYIDLLLIHQPFGDYYGTYRAMEQAYAQGQVKAVGVSNFFADRLVDLCLHCKIPPMVNQMETHVFYQQKQTRIWMDKYKVLHESWGPFAEGRNNFFSHPELTRIASKYGKSVAQLALRFLIEKGVAVIPKSTHKERMAENFAIFDFKLEEEDLKALTALDANKSSFLDHYAPETAEMLSGWKI
ncbi:MAG: aldo/keto reductase [Succinivibrio sp.]|nr:aldo/keto reductase [Succinivibrio sp.]